MEDGDISIIPAQPGNRLLELERKVKELEIENRKLELANYNLNRQIKKLENEIRQLKAVPMVVGTVEDVVDKNKAIVKLSNGGVFLVNSMFPVSAGDRVGLQQQSLAVIKKLPREVDRFVKAAEVIDRPNVTFEDIGGLEDQIKELKEIVELPLKNPKVFKEVGIEPPKGVLLYGPPGCGKTLLVKALARESDATFIRVVGSELVRKYIGEGAKLVKQIFNLAREKAPSILFIDEIDAVAARRMDETTGGDREVNRTLMQILAELDGFNDRGEVKIIGATNRIDILDPAILRPGRFDRLIEVPLPDEKARMQIFKVHTRKMKLSKNVSLKKLAKMTEGANGAEIRAICTEAGMFAIRKGKKKVDMEDFLDAIEKVMVYTEEEEPGIYYT